MPLRGGASLGRWKCSEELFGWSLEEVRSVGPWAQVCQVFWVGVVSQAGPGEKELA